MKQNYYEESQAKAKSIYASTRTRMVGLLALAGLGGCLIGVTLVFLLNWRGLLDNPIEIGGAIVGPIVLYCIAMGYVIDSEISPKMISQMVEWYKSQGYGKDEMELIHNRAVKEYAGFAVRAALLILVIPAIIPLLLGLNLITGIFWFFAMFALMMGLKEVVDRTYAADLIQHSVEEWIYEEKVSSRIPQDVDTPTSSSTSSEPIATLEATATIDLELIPEKQEDKVASSN
jgi:hypothetical protein